MKDAYYFPHDSNAKDDPKCILLIEQLGLEGYGIFWVLIETLRDQSNYRYPLSLLPALARRFNTTAEKMKTVVCQYGLFQTEDDEFFFSQSLIDRMGVFERKRQLASIAGKKSAEKRLLLNGGSTDVEQSFNNSSTIKVNKSKVNKRKDISETSSHTQFIPPSLDEVKSYCKERNNKVDAEKWHDFYSSKGWMVGKNKMKDWKAAVRTWEREAKESYPPGYKPPSKPQNAGNFNQRQYDDKYFDGLYENK